MSTKEPLLTLSPNPQPYLCTSPRCDRKNNIDTTPKLPKRERLASFSRLLKSKSLNGLLITEKCSEIHPLRELFPKEDSLKSDIIIQVFNSSPQKNIPNITEKEWSLSPYLQVSGSPRIHGSPMLHSPNIQLTPFKSPIYTPNRTGIFLGRGSFGNVTLCEYKGKKFALKVINQFQTFVGEENFLDVIHPHLVKVFCVSKTIDKVLIFMEFAGYCNMQQILNTKSEIDFHRRLGFCIQVASALKYCHKNYLVHGDVKPANVIVSPFGVCKIGDFGHSKNIKSDETNNFSEEHVGTAAYAAPEVLKGGKHSEKSDIYSFGILLWQVHTKDIPFGGEHPHIIIYKVVHYGDRPKFSNLTTKAMDLYASITKLCWSEAPEKRPDMAEVLKNLLCIKSVEKND